MPTQDKTDLLAISLDKRVTALEQKFDSLEKAVRASGDTPKNVAALEGKIKQLEDKKQDKKDEAAVAQKLTATMVKQQTELAKQQTDLAKQTAKDSVLEARLIQLEIMVKQALALAASAKR